MISLLLKLFGQHCQNEMNDGHIPAPVLIIKDNKMLLNKGYGYANIKNKQKVSNTALKLLLIQSNDGYAIMQLVNERKIKLNDPSKYIPNFHMKYKGKK